MRLNKFLSAIGLLSRREADRAIEAGRVYINQKRAVLGDDVKDTDIVYLDKKKVPAPTTLEQKKEVVIALYKPSGIVCTTSDKDRAMNVVDFVNYTQRIFPIGRLDKESTGLLLLTNDGTLVNAIMKASQHHEKEYIVHVNKEINDIFIKQMAGGIYLPELKVKTRKCRVEKLDVNTFKIVLTQGLNRQIRRMCEALGYHVKTLHRIRIMNITLGDLKEGTYRQLKEKEKQILYRMAGLENT